MEYVRAVHANLQSSIFTLMRILHLIHQYPPEFVGGSELHTQRLARRQAAAGHEVAVFTRVPGSGMTTREDTGVRIYAAGHGTTTPTQRFLATWGDGDLTAGFDRALEAVQPDLIHIQHMMGQPYAIFRRIRTAQIPAVMTLHDFWWVCANAQLLTNYSREICAGPALWLNCARCMLARGEQAAAWVAYPALPPLLGVRSRMLRAVMEYAAALLAPCAFVRDWYADHGAPPDRTRVLPLGIDAPPEEAGDAPPVRRANEPLRVLYAGGLAWQKGVHILLEAARSVTGPLAVEIAGDPADYPAYVADLRELADARVHFLGRLDRAALWTAMRRAHLIAVPARWYETYSFLIREAFAVQRPVFASNLGAPADAVRHDVDGLLLPPGDVEAWRAALQRAVDEPALLTRLGAAARPPMTLEAESEQTLAIYADVLRAA